MSNNKKDQYFNLMSIKDDGLAQAYDLANRGTWTPNELEEYLKAGMKRGDDKNALLFAEESGIEKGVEIGKELGVEIGERNNKISVIIKGHENGLSIAILSAITNMSAIEVEVILKENGLI